MTQDGAPGRSTSPDAFDHLASQEGPGRPVRRRRPSRAAAVAAFALLAVTAGWGGLLATHHAWAKQEASRTTQVLRGEPWAATIAAQPDISASSTVREADAVSFGPTEGKRTLVLWDAGGSYEVNAELAAIMAGNLATHFGRVTAVPVGSYRAGQMAGYDAVLYVGAQYTDTLNAAFVRDVLAGATPVLWAGDNVHNLAMNAEPQFIARYGWDAITAVVDTSEPYGAVRYKDRTLTRDAGKNGGLIVPRIVNPAAVTVLAEAECGPDGGAACTSPQRTAEGRVPWAIRSANLTYVGELPFQWVDETDRYLIYADLLYDLLAPDTQPVRQAAVRLEDVSPISDPAGIRAYADYLGGEGVPFQIAVIANFVDRRGEVSQGTPRNLTLADRPELVEALKYAQSKGATLIQHGTTHQFGELDNPYNGVSGDDFEFYRAGCSVSGRTPEAFIRCEQDTPVAFTGPVGDDDVERTKERILGGRGLFEQAGLEAPTIFETPHYLATPNAYTAMRQVYETRYERGTYADGLLTGKPTSHFTTEQVFPYSVTDIFGSKILPETLENYSPRSYSGNPARFPRDLVDAARANLVVRESTASFFYHPYLPMEPLKEIVEGIRAEGYTFVAAAELK